MAACDFERKVCAFHDGELSAEDERLVREHLARCGDCGRTLKELRAMTGLFASARIPDLSADAMKRLHKVSGVVVERTLFRTSEFVAAMAAAVLVVCSVWLWRLASGEEPALTPWEGVAVTLRDDSPASDTETQVAQWIVTDLAGGDVRD